MKEIGFNILWRPNPDCNIWINVPRFVKDERQDVPDEEFEYVIEGIYGNLSATFR